MADIIEQAKTEVKVIEQKAAVQWGFVRSFIAKRPLTSVWIAFGLGIVVAPYGKQFFELALAALSAILVANS